MLASIVIEYKAKSLNKVFDYIIPNELVNTIKVGHKVIVPFASSEVEGFVLKIHNNYDESLSYKQIVRIVDSDFYLNDELINLGKYMSNSLLCTLISCYQVMLPKALKASIKTNIKSEQLAQKVITKFYQIFAKEAQNNQLKPLKLNENTLAVCFTDAPSFADSVNMAVDFAGKVDTAISEISELLENKLKISYLLS